MKIGGMVDVNKLAKLMGVTPSWISRLVKEGLPRQQRGTYDASDCILWYVRYLQKKLKEKAVPTGDGLYTPIHAEKARAMRADASLKEIELAEKRKELISVSEVAEVFLDLVVMTKARIMTVPAKIAAEVTAEMSRLMIQAKSQEFLEEALASLAKDGSNYTPKRIR